MRAARALDMLLILQRRGRSSARELATELEVSERTVLRDVQVLGEAGVPIFTTQGAQGGIELMDGFETNLTGLTSDEALTLFLVGQPRIAHRLGLGAPAKTARRKLVAALPKSLVAEADALSDWFIHDPDPWTGHNIPHGELRRIGSCIRRRRRIELTIDGDPDPATFAPAGLVLKAGSWIMIHLEKGQPQVLPLDGLRTTRITNRAFSVPSGFSLEEFWEAHASLP